MPDLTEPASTGPADAHADDVSRLTHFLENELGCSEIILHKERRWRPVRRAAMVRNGKPTGEVCGRRCNVANRR